MKAKLTFFTLAGLISIGIAGCASSSKPAEKNSNNAECTSNDRAYCSQTQTTSAQDRTPASASQPTTPMTYDKD